MPVKAARRVAARRYWLASCQHLAIAQSRATGPADRIYPLDDAEFARRTAILESGGKLAVNETVEFAIALAARDPESVTSTLRWLDHRLRRPCGPATLERFLFARRMLRILSGTAHRLQREEGAL